ncbi:unnamed protein product [Ambrosiozyma monospora]|uniref:Unnamed protein product n=1 Tax=Ambrosiozyma monospora TaxID=43982 RepID=A0ACB5T4Q7_AMBMO|nr:unnamed protein product [Ambrosiozyma monospora]
MLSVTSRQASINFRRLPSTRFLCSTTTSTFLPLRKAVFPNYFNAASLIRPFSSSSLLKEAAANPAATKKKTAAKKKTTTKKKTATKKKATKKAGAKKTAAKKKKPDAKKAKKPKEPTVTEKKRSEKPKNAPNAYALFVQDYFQNKRLPSEKFVDANKNAAARWKSLSESERAPFQQKASVLLQAKHIADDAWNRKYKKEPSGYIKFVKDRYSTVSVAGLPEAKEYMKKFAGEWKLLSPEEKTAWKTK